MPIKNAGMKILLVVYVFILAFIIFLAGRKGTRHLLGFVGQIPYGDKLGHFFLMGIFSFLLNLVLKAKTVHFGRINILLGNLIVLIIVTLEEFSQLYIRGRTFDLADLAVDYLGIFIFGQTARFLVSRKFNEDPQK